MKFNKEKFLQYVDKATKEKMRPHLDMLDGKEVEHDSMIRCTVEGKAWMLYPVEDAWCDK